ncbi:MAG: apolipoprotein N-acyltransferase, partial [Candidatus Nanopelagicales bacterium]|nr:apolipoprotein N-acyltransferase [Candidatus Nanopelagicales bacterium]
FLRAFVGGAVFFLLLLTWLMVVGQDAWVLLSVVCAIFVGLMGIGIALVSRLPAWPLWVAGVWVGQEWLRGSFPFGGFPWGSLAFAQADTTFGRSSMVVGVLGATGLVVLVAAGLVAAVLAMSARDWSRAGAWLTMAIAVVVAPLLLHPPTSGDTVGGAESARIGLVQGSTPELGLGALDVRRAVLDNHVRETVTLAREIAAGRIEAPAFVLWPENSSDLDPFRDAQAAAMIGTAVRAIDVPVLVGAVVDIPGDPTSVLNQGIVWDPRTGPGATYSKTHPVPFGEYIPFRSLVAPLIDRFSRIGRDFAAGSVPGLMSIGGVAVGDVICFEIAYSTVIDPLIDGGARVLTVQTNNATYGGTSQPEQQFAIERVRALETGRSVVVAATTGISAFIRPDGSVDAQLGQGEVGALVREVALRGARNPSAWLGRPLAALWVLAALGMVGWSVAQAIRRRGERQRKVAG